MHTFDIRYIRRLQFPKVMLPFTDLRVLDGYSFT